MVRAQTLENANQWRLVLRALGEESRIFAATARSRPALEEFLHCAMELVQGDSGSIMLLVSEGTELEVVVASGPQAKVVLGRRQPVSASIAGLAARNGEPMLLKGRAETHSAFPKDFAWSVVVPMIISGQMIGVMSINCDESRELDPSVSDLLTLLSRQAGIFVETARLYGELDRKQKRLELLLDKLLYQENGSGPDREGSGVSLAGPASLAPVSVPGGSPPPSYPFAERLTKREHEVLSLLVEGQSNKEIAGSLSISLATVKSHVREAIGKLGAMDRTQAAVIALRRGLVN